MLFNKMSAKTGLVVTTAAIIALSPAFAPQALASPNVTWSGLDPSAVSAIQGKPVGFSVTPSVSGLSTTSGVYYGYHFSLYDSSGIQQPSGWLPADLQFDSPTANGTPMVTGNVPDSSVYGTASSAVYNAGTNPDVGSLDFGFSPIDVGSYQAKVQLYNESTNTSVGGAVYVPINVSPAAPGLDLYAPPFTATGQKIAVQVNPGQALLQSSSPLVYHLQVLKNGHAPAVNDVNGAAQFGPNLTSISLRPDGTADFSSPLSSKGYDLSNLMLTFHNSNPGQFTVYLSVLDASNGTLLASGQTNITAGPANVSGTVKLNGSIAPQGTTVTLASTSQSPKTGSTTSAGTAQSVYEPQQALVNQDGSYSLFVPADTPLSAVWMMVPDQTGAAQSFPINPPVPIDWSSGKGTANVNLLTGTLSGKAYVDSSTPFANGSFVVAPVVNQQVEQSDTTQVQTDSQGNFSVSLPQGSYEIVGAVLPGGVFLPMQQQINVGSSTKSIEIALPPIPPIAMEGPSSVLAQADTWYAVALKPGLKLPSDVYFTLTATQSGQQVASGITSSFTNQGEKVNAGASISSLRAFGGTMVQLSFAQAGTYNVTINIVDASTGQTVDSASQVITADPSDVTGTVYGADGKTPVPFSSFELTSHAPATNLWMFTGPNGHFAGNIPAGTWQITEIQDGSTSGKSLSSPQTITVPQTGTKTVSITDPFANVVGTVSDGQGNPIVNGFIAVEPQEATDPSAMRWYPTDGQGRFAMTLKPGATYTIVQAGGNGAPPITLNQQVQAPATGYVSITVAPPQPDFQLTVTDALGNLVTSGWVNLHADPSNATSRQEVAGPQPGQNEQSFQIQSDGTVSGYLPKGDYTIDGISTPQAYYPLQFNLDIQDPKLKVAKNVGPGVATLHGRLTDSSGHGLQGAALVLSPQSDPNRQIFLSADAHGWYTSFGWNQSGQYGDLVQVGKTYVVDGIVGPQGWTSIRAQSFTATAGMLKDFALPAPDLTGTVSVDGTTIQSGGIGFLSQPANSGNQTSASGGNGSAGANVQWYWAQIQNGHYQVNLPVGTYTVYGVADDHKQMFYSEQGDAQTVEITNASTVENDPFSFVTNFVGSLISNGHAVQYAGLQLSQTPDPTDGSQVEFVSTDASGHFATSLKPGTWYVLGYVDKKGTYVQVDQSYDVKSSAIPNLVIDVTPDVTGNIVWDNSPSAVRARLVVQNTQTKQVVTTPVDITQSGWTYSFSLSAGTYQVLGISTMDANHKRTWTDLSMSGQTLSVKGSGTPVSQNVTVSQGFSGTVQGNGLDGQSGQVQFKNSSTGEIYDVAFTNGSFTVPFGNQSGWTVLGVSTPANYYKATAIFSNGSWIVTVQQA
ncbi:hypothetical protein LLE49_10415 [Alicyclobacillus tolerans]|uniref:hypothetical protein n=1 Tax=Alicyclobacillus tolerans TaxID=90970 RepID=UPI001F28FF26|nr:hypothetical protein [Alicyclobacillus tolerans]MCF8565127.1 hypothetical protein [Alicyclobacillus tolerans]